MRWDAAKGGEYLDVFSAFFHKYVKLVFNHNTACHFIYLKIPKQFRHHLYDKHPAYI